MPIINKVGISLINLKKPGECRLSPPARAYLIRTGYKYFAVISTTSASFADSHSAPVNPPGENQDYATCPGYNTRRTHDHPLKSPFHDRESLGFRRSLRCGRVIDEEPRQIDHTNHERDLGDNMQGFDPRIEFRRCSSSCANQPNEFLDIGYWRLRQNPMPEIEHMRSITRRQPDGTNGSLECRSACQQSQRIEIALQHTFLIT